MYGTGGETKKRGLLVRSLFVKTVSTLLICFLIISPISFLTPTKVSAGINEWTVNGPEGGYVGTLAISPNYSVDQTIFARSDGGGVFKSSDGGANWSPVNTGLTNLWVQEIAISPNYAIDQTILAGTFNGGVFKSTDGGANWNEINTGLTNTWIVALAISPNYSNDQTIFIGAWNDGGVSKSNDGGASWSPVNTGLTDLGIEGLYISPDYSNDKTIFARTGGGVFKSNNGGDNWGSVNAGLPNTDIWTLTISSDYSNDQTIFASINGGVYKSTEGGTNWIQINTGLSPNVRALIISPNYSNDQIIFAGTSGGGVFPPGDGVFKFSDNGTSWSQVNTALKSTSINSLAIAPDFANDQTIFAAAGGGGVFKSSDGGANWSPVNTGITAISIKALAISPNYVTDQVIFAGTLIGGVFKSSDDGVSWSPVNTGITDSDIKELIISPNYLNDQTIFAITGGDVFKSTDGGGNWSQVSTIENNIALDVSPDYSNDGTIFAGTWNNGIFKSIDGGANWSAVNTGLTNSDVVALAISPNYSNDQTIFAGTLIGGVFKSSDDGVSWSPINAGLASATIEEFAISPNYSNDQTIFAGGFNYGVYKSTDGGANWNKVSTGSTNAHITSLVISPNFSNDQTIFVGTTGGFFRESYGGVFKSNDGGANWNPVNMELTNAEILSLAISPNYSIDETIFIGTERGGIFSYSFADAKPPVTTLDLNPSSPDGDNGWFKTTPTTISLSPDETATTFYSWDSTTSATTYTVPLSYPSEGIHTLYYYSIDSANNTETIKSQLFKVDTTGPSDPTSVTSPSHNTSQWSTNNDVSIEFSDATDTVSGINGYSVSWSENGTETPNTSIDLQEDATSTTSGALDDGVWYFNLRTRDNADNWTSTVHLGPFWIGKPDLVITSIAPSKQNPTTGEVVSVDVVIKNQGTADADVYDVILFNNPLSIPLTGDPGSFPPDIIKGSSGLAAGASQTLTFSNVIWPTIGKKDLYAIVDTANDIVESNEDNNVFGPVNTNVYDNKLEVLNSWDSGPNNWNFDASKSAKGDFDGDGRDDIAVVYGYKTERDVLIYVFKGQSNGTFAAPVKWWQAGAGNWDWEGSKLTAGDYNNDGKDDLAIMYGYKTERDVIVFVFKSAGNKFNTPTNWFQAGRNNWDWDGSKLVTGDFNGDGKDDLAVLYGYQTERDVIAFVFTSTGSKFSSPRSWFHAGRNNWDWAGSKLEAGDFNGDGKDDLVILYGYQTERDVIAFVFTSKGGSFSSPRNNWQAGRGNWDWAGSKLVPGDYNGDGKDDLAIFYGYGSSRSAVFVFLSNGSTLSNNGIWYISPEGGWNAGNTKIFSGDFDGDGIDNLAGVYGLGTSQVRLFMIK